MPFNEKIVAWYQQHGRKDLAWQQAKGVVKPYHVWLSEIMLQQTQVVKVKDYFCRFITELPTLKQLAEADEQQVLSLWSGLGYYNRARNLHKAAQICAEEHQGQLPENLNALMALPGIGRSTAAAIMSLAYGLPEPIMDGNVKRVFARHFLVDGEPNKSATLKQFWELAEQHKAHKNPAAYTQGLMDLGAMVCTKHQPQCEKCPISSSCLAKAKGVIANYPEKKRKVVQLEVDLYCLLREREDQIAVELRTDNGIWPQLWFVPSFDSEQDLLKVASSAKHLFSLTHKLTHRILQLHVYHSTETSEQFYWIKPAELKLKPHPKALEHILTYYENHQLH
ncbi:MAG: A/G-specific adenine glycosylase [Marinicella sp.]